MSQAVIPLARLRAALPSVDLGGNAGVHAVQPISGTAMQLLQLARDGTDSSALWEVAALCVPSAPREAVFALSVPEAEAIVGIASGTADQVMEQVGNAAGPTPENPPAPAP